MHSLLRRQLKKLNLLDREAFPDEINKLIDRVNDAYMSADEDRKLLENSLTLSSQEVQELYSELKKKSETELAKSESRYRNLVTKLEHHYFFFSQNAAGDFTSISDSVKDFLGYQPEEMFKSFESFLSEDPMNRDAINKKRVTLRGKIQSPYYVSFNHKDLSERILEITEAPVIEKGNVIGVDGIARDVTKEFNNHQALEFLAQNDPLTGIYNRHAFENQIKQLINIAKRHDEKLALLFIDLDNFKNINDTLGHDIGDQLLVEVVNRMKPNIRAGDLFARLGGDEFVLVVNEICDASLIPVLQKIMTLMRESWQIDNYKLNISASIGVSIFPSDGNTLTELMKKADLALYKAKGLGKDNFCFYTESLDKIIHEEMLLSQDIEKALAEDQFIFHYQPKAQLQNDVIIGAEALIRWQHPEKGLIYPDKFINLAENTGYIREIGRWVIEEGCQAIARFNQICGKELHLSINVSVRQLQFGGLFETVKEAIDNAGIDPSQLSLEITETIMLDPQSVALKRLDEIKTLGVEICMDDFGTGYSSLSYLNRLPIDGIKIDKSFVDKIDVDATQSAIIDAITSVGKSMSMRVIAEGVETESQRQSLLNSGLLFYQGYLFSKPLPENEYVNLIISDSPNSLPLQA